MNSRITPDPCIQHHMARKQVITTALYCDTHEAFFAHPCIDYNAGDYKVRNYLTRELAWDLVSDDQRLN